MVTSENKILTNIFKKKISCSRLVYLAKIKCENVCSAVTLSGLEVNRDFTVFTVLVGFSRPNISSNFTPHSRRRPVYVIHHQAGVCVSVVTYFDSVKAAIVQPIIKISFPHLNARKRRNRLLDGKILPASFFFFSLPSFCLQKH